MRWLIVALLGLVAVVCVTALVFSRADARVDEVRQLCEDLREGDRIELVLARAA